MSECAIQTDGRTVIGVWTADGKTGAQVGMSGVTCIRVVQVAGNGAYVPWLEVWRGDNVWMRYNANQMGWVEYD